MPNRLIAQENFLPRISRICRRCPAPPFGQKATPPGYLVPLGSRMGSCLESASSAVQSPKYTCTPVTCALCTAARTEAGHGLGRGQHKFTRRHKVAQGCKRLHKAAQARFFRGLARIPKAFARAARILPLRFALPVQCRLASRCLFLPHSPLSFPVAPCL